MTLMKEIEDYTNRWKEIRVHGLEELILSKITILHKAMYRFNTILTKILRKNNSKICMETQKTLHSQNNLYKEQRCRNHAP